MSTVAITNAHVVPVASPEFDGTVVIVDGKISAFGADVEIPADATIIDAHGQWLTPGLVDSHCHVGIHEEGKGWAGADFNEGVDANGASLRAIDGIHPTDEGFRDALSGGVTTVVIKPGSAAPIGGTTVAVKCWGRIVDEMVIKDPCSMKAALGENPKRFFGQDQKKAPRTRMGVALSIRKSLVDAQNYAAAKTQAEKDGKPFSRDLVHEALLPVLSGELRWSQHVHRVDDIVTAVRLADEFGYNLVLEHGTEAHLIPDWVAKRDIPVIVGPIFTARMKQELDNRSTKSPGILAAAGVRVAITTDAPVVPINFLIYQAIVAAKDGMERDAAFEAVTLNPARFMDIADRVGSIEAGKDGDVVLWSGDPMDMDSRAMQVFIDGRAVYHYDDEAGVGHTVDPYVALAETAGK